MPRARKRLHGKKRKRSALKQTNPYSVNLSENTADENKMLMDGYRRQAEQRKATRSKAKAKEDQYKKDMEFVKNSTNQVLRGEDPISQAFGLVAGGGVGGALSKAAQARNLKVVKKAIDVGGKIKKAKSLS
jgi:methylthioribose-1-phosphate isomerase